MTDPDPLLAELAGLDPAATDLPPTRGSVRDRQILEHAMSTATDPRPEADPVPVDRPTRRRRLRPALLAGAAVAAAVLTVVVVARPDGNVDPVAAVTMAADAMGDVDTLRVRGTYEDSRGTRTLESEVDGSNSNVRFTNADGSTGEWRVVIGDQEWDDEEDGPTTVTPDMVNAPFPEASQAVVNAALKGAEVREVGTEDVSGVETTHYAIELGEPGIAALAALPPAQTARFELEWAGGVQALDVWVADDLIRRIRVVNQGPAGPDGEDGTVTVTLEFSDFGADITIRPPA